KKMAEDAKVSVRNTRKDANKKVAALVKEEDLSEDEQKRAEAQIQKLTDDYVAKIDQVLVKKQDEIMTI
ncbi:MAG: ribosome recycling factor, partial [Coriobacteriales bacterium]|nr:ribosome recycling factor [Coriobacteriales bacterium]